MQIAKDSENKNIATALKALGKQYIPDFRFEEELLSCNWTMIGKDILLLMICRSEPSSKLRKYLFTMALVEAL
jgi:hypothetical protein